MTDIPTVALSVPACRDCRFSVPDPDQDGPADEDLARCTSPSAAMLGTPHYHLAIADAPRCSTMRDSEVCGPAATLFEARPVDESPGA